LARLAARNAPPESWHDLVELFDRTMQRIVDTRDLNGYDHHYEHFRRRLMDAAGSPTLAELLERLNDMTSTSAAASLSSPTAPSTRCTITATCCLRCSGAMPPQRRITIANVCAAVERYQAFIL
jgi:DNA-binding GntR family transcriptional regulator